MMLNLNLIRRCALVMLLSCSINFLSQAQTSSQVLEMVNTVKSDDRGFTYEIPFDYRNGMIVIKVKVGGGLYDYIFDTGGYNNITPKIQQLNHFPVLTKQEVGSTNQLKRKVAIMKVDSVGIGGLVFKDVAMLEMDYSNVPTFQCGIDGGLIGASIIKKYIWQIDYPNKKIIVTDQLKNLPGIQGATRLPVTFNSRQMPFIDVLVDGHHEKMMFDLGSGSQFSMTKKSAERYGRLKGAITIFGGATEGGNGVVRQDVKVFKAAEIKMGSLSLVNRPVLYAATNNENLVGNHMIRDHVITLNFPENEMYLSPIADQAEQGWSSFGFSVEQDGGKLIVGTLYSGLVGERQGLKLRDEILAVDGKVVSCQDTCACRELARSLLLGKESISLTIVRDGQKMEIAVKREKVF